MKKVAMLLVVLGLVLGIGQYFVQRKPAVRAGSEGLLTGCDSLIPDCGYCPDDPRPHCGKDVSYVAEEATFGVPYAFEREGNTDIFVGNFLIFFVPAAFAGGLVWWVARRKQPKIPKRSA